ncbi:MAG: nuclease PIN [Bacteroidetes bacterium MedPE-SWsnd-G2]|nr:MAG: nuclease PIN [Bacteroidetes bacterium MedPE-SWsnd-G2]
MKRNTIDYVGGSPLVNMGPIQLRQPLPNSNVEMVDPFLLLHHYGPFAISEEDNPFDLGPHPHRGFEPITFLLQGEQLHRDSLNNESIVKAGDVQWTTAGRGIIHSEGPNKAFVEKGGVLEGIQLWLNLPADKKMMTPKYQHITSDQFNKVGFENINIKVVAGEIFSTKGKIETESDITVALLKFQNSEVLNLPINENHSGLIYLINGNVSVNESIQLQSSENQIASFNADGDHIQIKSIGDAQLLFLSGVPFDEKVVSWGPYVMNSQTEIMEALRDYQMGKMGFLTR